LLLIMELKQVKVYFTCICIFYPADLLVGLLA